MDKPTAFIYFHFNPKGTKTEWNSEPLKILKKLKVLSGNWTYDFKKDRKNIFYDKILKFQDFQGGQKGKNYVSLSF